MNCLNNFERVLEIYLCNTAFEKLFILFYLISKTIFKNTCHFNKEVFLVSVGSWP